mgnify:CR=1 FL=1
MPCLKFIFLVSKNLSYDSNISILFAVKTANTDVAPKLDVYTMVDGNLVFEKSVDATFTPSNSLEKVGFAANDELYILGDVIDRGDFSRELLEWIIDEPRIKLVLGNHEIFAALIRYAVHDMFHTKCSPKANVNFNRRFYRRLKYINTDVPRRPYALRACRSIRKRRRCVPLQRGCNVT